MIILDPDITVKKPNVANITALYLLHSAKSIEVRSSHSATATSEVVFELERVDLESIHYINLFFLITKL